MAPHSRPNASVKSQASTVSAAGMGAGDDVPKTDEAVETAVD
jgi:hypothetical protein